MNGLIQFVVDMLELVGLASHGSIEEPRKEISEESSMPLVQIDDLPNNARTWVFGADRPLDQSATNLLLHEVDRFLSQWHAHGAPLTSARDWKYGRFLTVAVDQSTAGASGCSIDGLFRSLKALEPRLGASLVPSGVVFFRGRKGAIECVDRERFTALSAEGKIHPDTHVFDPTVTTLGEWRARFELEAAQSWHSGLLHDKQPA
jgi:hypothetical protein